MKATRADGIYIQCCDVKSQWNDGCSICCRAFDVDDLAAWVAQSINHMLDVLVKMQGEIENAANDIPHYSQGGPILPPPGLSGEVSDDTP